MPAAVPRPDAGLKEVMAALQARGLDSVELQFGDVAGRLKSVTVPARRLPECLDRGEWFDGSAAEGLTRELESDMYLVPDLSTFAIVPGASQTDAARLICKVVTPDGEASPGDPRGVLAGVLERLHHRGYQYCVAPETEFFLFRVGADGAPVVAPQDSASYFDHSADVGWEARQEIVRALEASGSAVESSHHEVATGQHEIVLPFQPALRAADAIATMKPVAKAVARRHGLFASFVPKPLYQASGSGMHTHQELLDGQGRNAFTGAEDPYGLSALARRFVAGQLAHARGMAAVCAPLVNSYKRLVSGYEAPAAVCWARLNRSALIRIPSASRGNGGARVEFRLPDPSCNPYLAFTVMLASGLGGLERDLTLPDPVEEGMHVFDPAALIHRSLLALPASLEEALNALREDDVVQDALGPTIVDRFLAAKEIEWEGYRKQVTPWELETYLSAY